MAIAPDKTDTFDDLLTCTICLETFTGPKYLPCLHTFCTACINTYILSTAGKEKTKTTFKCPICRQNVLMSESTGNPKTWAEKIPGNHFVASMMDRQAIRRNIKRCYSWKANNESTNPLSWCIVCEEAFCESCEKCHKSFKMTKKKKHPIMLLKDLVTNKESDEIKSLKKEADLKLYEQSPEIESLKSTVDNWTTIFDTCLQHGSELQCLLEMNRINENKVTFGNTFTEGTSEMKNVSMLLETNDIAEKFAERVAVIRVVKLVETNTSCPKLSFSKNLNFRTGENKCN
ncbi:TRIM56 [Mytilus coruscus]|uniref:TRIM56 n=1 Tax=Mytilus coruscus TaxID=42192 RepID=A0A6J8D656_MYTCO|nr:TRIM56 [Mytilus coruscus]